MTQPKFTPGRWESAGGAVYAGVCKIAQCNAEEWREIIAPEAAPFPLEDAAFANTRLIAATPDLFAALVLTLATLNACGGNTAQEREAATLAARAALEKAVAS